MTERKENKPGTLTLFISEIIEEGSLAMANKLYYEEFGIGEKLGLDYHEGQLFQIHFARHALQERIADLSYALRQVPDFVPSFILIPPLHLERTIHQIVSQLEDKANHLARDMSINTRVSIRNAANLFSNTYLTYADEPEMLRQFGEDTLSRIVISR